ncbi:hypothetical protein [Pseudoclavibacter sp. AY1F1]|uniref:hypothetical protein n=1 Tax=Pseudoclavibacter sp. AY1F1 TaxID=2080583 RepID=UPI0015E3F5D2|nr:hypothetical protein [Pseudoclavibacter sp. AY1F1]
MTQGTGAPNGAAPRPGAEVAPLAPDVQAQQCLLPSSAPVAPYDSSVRGEAPAAPAEPRRNIWGMWALGVAALSLVLAFIPVPVLNIALALSVAAVGCVLAVIALWQKRRSKALGIIALVTLFVGVLASVVMTFVYLSVISSSIANL